MNMRDLPAKITVRQAAKFADNIFGIVPVLILGINSLTE